MASPSLSATKARELIEEIALDETQDHGWIDSSTLRQHDLKYEDEPTKPTTESGSRSTSVHVSNNHTSTHSESGQYQGKKADLTPPGLQSISSRQPKPRSIWISQPTPLNTFHSSSILSSGPQPTPDSVSGIEINDNQNDDAYAKLLSQVIDAARRNAGNFPSKAREAFDMDELSEIISGGLTESSTVNIPFGKSSDGQMDIDLKGICI